MCVCVCTVYECGCRKCMKTPVVFLFNKLHINNKCYNWLLAVPAVVLSLMVLLVSLLLSLVSLLLSLVSLLLTLFVSLFLADDACAGNGSTCNREISIPSVTKMRAIKKLFLIMSYNVN